MPSMQTPIIQPSSWVKIAAFHVGDSQLLKACLSEGKACQKEKKMFYNSDIKVYIK